MKDNRKQNNVWITSLWSERTQKNNNLPLNSLKNKTGHSPVTVMVDKKTCPSKKWCYGNIFIVENDLHYSKSCQNRRNTRLGFFPVGFSIKDTYSYVFSFHSNRNGTENPSFLSIKFVQILRNIFPCLNFQYQFDFFLSWVSIVKLVDSLTEWFIRRHQKPVGKEKQNDVFIF